MAKGGNLDKAGLISALAGLQLRAPCHVMVHASLSALGVVDGGASTVVAALRDMAGPEGAVIIPSFRDAIRSDHYALRECQEKCPQVLCPSREPGHTGIIGETLREQPDALRSCHPTHSWVGIGGGANFLLEGHRHSLTPCGKESPFFRLMQKNGAILLLGVGVNAITNVHAVEDARNVPYLSAVDPPRRHATYTTSGRRIQYVYPDLLFSVFREAGILRSGRIGASTSHLIDARALGSFLWVVTEDDPWCLVLRPKGDHYEPFQDACAKAARMVRVWQNQPDHEAWQLLVERSHQQEKPVFFEPTKNPVTQCPAYRGPIRGYPRCAASDIPPWEKFEDYPRLEPGVATCDQCNWPGENKPLL
jgi:aminoglycoside 3-N-acetyltransferase